MITPGESTIVLEPEAACALKTGITAIAAGEEGVAGAVDMMTDGFPVTIIVGAAEDIMGATEIARKTEWPPGETIIGAQDGAMTGEDPAAVLPTTVGAVIAAEEGAMTAETKGKAI